MQSRVEYDTQTITKNLQVLYLGESSSILGKLRRAGEQVNMINVIIFLIMREAQKGTFFPHHEREAQKGDLQDSYVKK